MEQEKIEDSVALEAQEVSQEGIEDSIASEAQEAPNRRDFLMKLGGAGLAGAALFGGASGTARPALAQTSGPDARTYGVNSIAALKAETPVSSQRITALGYNSPGDGGGGLFRWDGASSTADDGGVTIVPNSNPATGRWIRVVERPLNVLWFGAKGNDAAADTQAFQKAIAYSKASSSKKTIEVPYVGQDYRINEELLLEEQKLFSHDARTTLTWPNDLGANKYAITLIGGATHQQRCRLENLRLIGNGSFALGSAPCQMHGVRAGRSGDNGANGAANKPVLRNVKAEYFNYGFILDNSDGHISAYDCAFEACYYGLYVGRGNGDYLFVDCAFSGTFAGVELPGNTGLHTALFERCQIGFSPYGIYQSDIDDTRVSGSRMTDFLGSCVFLMSSFEACGNGAFVTDSTTNGNMTGNHVIDCYHSWNDGYRITSRNRDWAIKTRWCEFNFMSTGKSPWSLGDLGLIKNGTSGQWRGANAWELTGKLPDVPAGKVLIEGERSYARLRPYGTQDKEVTIPAGSTSATYNLLPYEQAQTGNIRPVVTPRSDPGTRYWVTKTDSSVTVNLAAGAPTGGVTFNLHLFGAG